MRIYLAAVEEGSFTRASIRESISQPAASIIINEIEETIGCALFERRGTVRKAEVTETGQLVAETFSRIITGYDSELGGIAEMSSGRRASTRILFQRSFAEALSGSWMLGLGNLLKPASLSYEICERSAVIDAVRSRDAVVGLIDGSVDDERSDHVQVGTYAMVLAVPEADDTEAEERVDSWESVPSDCLLLEDLNPRMARQVKRYLGKERDGLGDMTGVTGAVTTARIMNETKRPALVPDVLVPVIRRHTGCRMVHLPHPGLQASIDVVTPWGQLSRRGLIAATQQDCFDQEAMSA
ncbi:MAG: LysR family transcriptional regulator [Pseudomonadota bacterium]